MAMYANLNIKIDRELKANADKLFNEMGMTLSTAVNVFVRQAVQEKSIPFKIYRNDEVYTKSSKAEQRRAAWQESRDLLSEINCSDVDINKLRAERRVEKYECVD